MTLCRGVFGRRRQVWSLFNPHMHEKVRPAGSHPGEGPPGRQTHRWTAPVLGCRKRKTLDRSSPGGLGGWSPPADLSLIHKTTVYCDIFVFGNIKKKK